MLKRNSHRSLIFGCGDIGRRIAKYLIETGRDASSISGYVKSDKSIENARALGVSCTLIDLDEPNLDLKTCDGAEIYYTVAPQKQGLRDQRSRSVIKEFIASGIRPSKVVLISTTGVYGDCDGDWVSETSPTEPQTERGQRRLDSERQWLDWRHEGGVDVVVLRVPGIYAFSRLPRERLQRRTPIVRSNECGFSNRIHADDLARVCVIAMAKAPAGEIYNVTDGVPGKMSEYLQAAAQVLSYEPLPEISMQQAQRELSAGMLSYLNESRKISNQKMLDDLNVELLYSDFKKGILN